MIPEMDIITAAFSHVKQLERFYGDTIPSAVIEQGFNFGGELVLLMNRAGGIFKPRQMPQGVLSIKTTMPRKGAAVNIYNDHGSPDGYYQYSLQQGDPHGGRNKCLWEAFNNQQPFIYFHAVAPAVYKAMWPCFIEEINPDTGYAKVLVGIAQPDISSHSIEYKIPDKIESRYQIRETKVRLHQASFREAVLGVYKHRCAITGMAQPRLIEAAHIVPDAKAGAHQLVNNGIALSNLHHRAYDRNLIGIDGDYRIHVSPEIKEHSPNDFVEQAFLKCDQQCLILPTTTEYRPSRGGLAERFELFSNHIVT